MFPKPYRRFGLLSQAVSLFLSLFQCVGHISGAHINPAVTAAAVIVGNTPLPIAGVYVIAQCLGGLIGYGLLKVNEYLFAYKLQNTSALYFGRPHPPGKNYFSVTDTVRVDVSARTTCALTQRVIGNHASRDRQDLSRFARTPT